MSDHPATQKAAVRLALLAWYDQNARTLPWRLGPQERRDGRRPDPYQVWLSEIMLQQTTTGHAAPFYHRFTRDWPTVFDLAAAEDGTVMSAWAGLGYYARARNLLACARQVVGELAGRFPEQEDQLRRLPGVGAYTAAALAAIAFDRAANVVDGNVERVMSRLFAVTQPLPAAKVVLASLAASLVDCDRPGDWAQALMDLGATLCTPTSPQCGSCPLAFACEGRRQGEPQRFPIKAPKPLRPRRFGVAYLVTRSGTVGLVRRPQKGLLGGMLALPTSAWAPAPLELSQRLGAAPAPAPWRDLGSVEHVFTHFALTLAVMGVETLEPWENLIWSPVASASAGLPTVFRKALTLGLSAMPQDRSP